LRIGIGKATNCSFASKEVLSSPAFAAEKTLEAFCCW